MSKLGIVVNNKARNADSLSLYLDALSQQGFDYQLYQAEPEHLDKIMKEAKERHSLLLVGGGDGSIRSAAQQCVNSSTVLGVLPLGTMNHFARELSLPANAAELVKALLSKKTVTIDVAAVNGAIFVNNSSIGLYPHFAKKRDYYTKFYNKWLCYIPGFLKAMRYHKSFSLTIRSKELNLSLKTSFLMISNNLYSYEFPLNFAREHFNKSLLGVYFFKHGKLEFAKLFRHFFNRRTNFAIKESNSPLEINIAGVSKINVSVDGEVLVMENPLRYQSFANALTILTDKS